MPYFLAVAEKARMFWSVISMLETPVLCFISCRRVCFPWCSLVLWPVTPFCISSSTFFMACCSIPAESLVASTQRATVRWVTSSCISHHLLSAVRKGVHFREKGGLYAAWIPQRGKPMGGGLSADRGIRNMGFLASSDAVLR